MKKDKHEEKRKMNNNRGGERTIYDESLFRIFLWSGFPIFMILLFACVAISGIVFIYRHSDPEGVKIIIFCFAVLIPVSYGSPFVSLFKAWKQQHKIGIFGKRGQIIIFQNGKEIGI